MKIAVYLCACGANISERIDFPELSRELGRRADVAYVKTADFICSEESKQAVEAELREHRPDRVVVAACSPREYERALGDVLERAGMNRYFLQFVNIREQVAWVTPGREQATAKAAAQIHAALARVANHRPLERKELEVCRDVLVIGAGPAGIKAALTLAEAGRKVLLVEKSPALGGMPSRYEELFPNMECGPCLLEPAIGDVLHGPHSANLEYLTLAEVTGVKGYYGNFTVTVRQSPRHVDAELCVGCGECVAPCPATTPNEFDCGLSLRKAIAFPYPGVLPNIPFLDEKCCLRQTGDGCTACQAACPVEGAVRYDDAPRTIERAVGAIIVAVGAGLYDCRELPELGYGTVPGVYTSLEFERIMASNGPTGGELRRHDGEAPGSVAIVHCVGSLSADHRPYCSGICCDYAFKFNHMIEKKLPGTKILHLYRELVMPGKEEFTLYAHARHNPHASFARYGAPVKVKQGEGHAVVDYQDEEGRPRSVAADLVVLCPAVTGSGGAGHLAGILETPRDAFGFFEELHGRTDSAQSKVKGIYIAGACQAPMDIQKAVNQGMAAAGYVLSGLAEGRKLEIDPITAWVDDERCSRCRTCGSVCPYKAISFPDDQEAASVNALLCHGCGTCVSACPAGAMRGNHFENDQILAELGALLV